MTSQSRIDIVVGALNMASAELKAIQKDIGALETSGKKAGLNIGEAFRKSGVYIAGAIGALYTAKKVFDFANEGAQLERLETAGRNLATSFGQSMGSLVDAIQEASNSAIPRMKAIEFANQALLLGVARTPAEFEKLTIASAALGQAMGRTTEEALSDIIRGIGRMSPLILDNLGIMTQGGKIFDTYAASVGTTADRLTDAQKKQILLNAALQSAQPLLADTGGLIEDGAVVYEVFAARVKDATDELKRHLYEGVLPVLQWLNREIESGEQWSEQMDYRRRAIQQLTEEGIEPNRFSIAKLAAEMEREDRVTATWTARLQGLAQNLAALPTGGINVPVSLTLVEPKTFFDQVMDSIRQKREDMSSAGVDSASAWIEGWMAENAGSAAAQAFVDEFLDANPGKTIQDALNTFWAQAETEGFRAYMEEMSTSLGEGNQSNTILGKLAQAQLDAAAIGVAAGDEGAWRSATQLSRTFGDTVYSWYRMVMAAVAAMRAGAPSTKGGTTRQGGFTEEASGGRLTGFDLVGDPGPNAELIVNGTVIPASITRKLLALGLRPRRKMGLGGAIDVTLPGGPINPDPYGGTGDIGSNPPGGSTVFGSGGGGGGDSGSATVASVAAEAAAEAAAGLAVQAAVTAAQATSASVAAQLPQAVLTQTREQNKIMAEGQEKIVRELRALRKSQGRAFRDAVAQIV